MVALRDVSIFQGDCFKVLPMLEEDSVDAVCTDPPYGLEFMGKEWDSFRGSNAGIKQSGFEKLSKNGTPTFSANRRNQKCDQCGKWAYDYPDRKCVCGGARASGHRIYARRFEEWCRGWATAVLRVLKPGGYMLAMGGTRTYHRLTCAVEDAGWEIRDCLMWLHGQGYPKGRGCLKPAVEPILLCRKPGKGVLPLGIDECRVPTDGEVLTGGPGVNGKGEAWDRPWMHDGKPRERYSSIAGRYPANVLHDGSDEVMEAFAAFPIHGAGKARKADEGTHNCPSNKVYSKGIGSPAMRFGDSGTAARFYYCAKASKRDRGEGNGHPTTKPTKLMQWLVKLVCPQNGTVLDPFLGSGTTAVACLREGRKCIGIEQSPEYVEIARRRVKKEQE